MLIKVYIENKGKNGCCVRPLGVPAAPVSLSKSPSTGCPSGEAGRRSLRESKYTPTLAALREKTRFVWLVASPEKGTAIRIQQNVAAK